MRVLMILTLSLIANLVFGQKEVVWEGGTPGNETNWNDSRNWSDNRVPDEFSDVIIPDVSSTTLSNPVIKEGTFEVNSLRLNSNAFLTLETKSALIIYTTAVGLKPYNTILSGSLKIVNENSDAVIAVKEVNQGLK